MMGKMTRSILRTSFFSRSANSDSVKPLREAGILSMGCSAWLSWLSSARETWPFSSSREEVLLSWPDIVRQERMVVVIGEGSGE